MNNLDLVLKAFATELSGDKLPSGKYNDSIIHVLFLLNVLSFRSPISNDSNTTCFAYSM